MKLTMLIITGLFLTCLEVHVAFGQDKPVISTITDTSSKPLVFAPGVVSTPYEEWSVSFTPDGNTVYFSEGTIYMAVCFSKKVNGEWTKPKIASFSQKWQAWDPFVTPDGKKLFYVSNQPLPDAPQNAPSRKSHLWYTDNLGGDSWSAAKLINEPFNLDGINDYAPAASKNGTLYFCSIGRGSIKGWSSYSVKWLGDHFDKPQLITVPGTGEIQDPFIAPDESYLMFINNNEIYISFRDGSGWAAAQKLGAQVNDGSSISGPYVSPDGKTLYYSSARVRGFYKANPNNDALDYDRLQKAMQSIFNGRPNILMIPVKLTGKS